MVEEDLRKGNCRNRRRRYLHTIKSSSRRITVCYGRAAFREDHILLATTNWHRSIRFSEEEVRPLGWSGGRALPGIKLTRPDEQVVAAVAPRSKDELLLVSVNGQAKRVPRHNILCRVGTGRVQ